MLNFSKTDTVANLVEAINALPSKTDTAEEEFITLAKNAAIERLELGQTDVLNGATIHLRANKNLHLKAEQLEIQIVRKIIATQTTG